MKGNRYSLHEVIFSGDTDEDRMLREDARVQQILEDVRYQLEGELIMEGWFSDMFSSIKGWFSDLFGFGGDGDTSDDPDQFKPTEKDLKGALSVGKGYGLLAKAYKSSKKGENPQANKAAKGAWKQVESVISDEWQGGEFGMNVDIAFKDKFSKINELESYVDFVMKIRDMSVNSAFKMNQGFGKRIVKAVKNVPLENFLPKEESKEKTKKEGRRYSLSNALFEQDLGTDKLKIDDDLKGDQGPQQQGTGDQGPQQQEKKPPSKEALAAAKKKQEVMISKTEQTAKEVFGNKAMAEFQCDALLATICEAPLEVLERKVSAIRSSKKDHWASTSGSKKANRAQIKSGLDAGMKAILNEKGVNIDESMVKIGMMVYNAYETKDPIKYYMGLLAAFKKSE